MAEAHCSSCPNPRADRSERRPASLARITVLPTERSNDLASARPDRFDQTAQARIAELEAENQALREQETRARLILDSATDYAIITLDTEGCVTSWNTGAQAIMGYTEAEIRGRSGEIVFTSED
ncbi:MAG: PAS domain S-box protein, partial [Oxalobacteraceae bacterium]